MAKIDCVKLTSWEEFKIELFRDLYTDSKYEKGKYVFRGHKNATWQLESSFDRWASDVPLAERASTFDELLADFRSSLEQSVEYQDLCSKEDELLALAQHYGLTTRLLDWTYSPYVAAFFAFSDSILNSSEAANEDVCVWAINRDSAVWSQANGATILDVPALGNSRLRNQEGCFTYLRAPFLCIEDYIGAFHDHSSTTLIRFDIPITEALKALSDLDAMGITYRRVYPEMEGVVKAARNNFLLKRNGIV